jgi:hypothetical protein
MAYGLSKDFGGKIAEAFKLLGIAPEGNFFNIFI